MIDTMPESVYINYLSSYMSYYKNNKVLNSNITITIHDILYYIISPVEYKVIDRDYNLFDKISDKLILSISETSYLLEYLSDKFNNKITSVDFYQILPEKDDIKYKNRFRNLSRKNEENNTFFDNGVLNADYQSDRIIDKSSVNYNKFISLSNISHSDIYNKIAKSSIKYSIVHLSLTISPKMTNEILQIVLLGLTKLQKKGTLLLILPNYYSKIFQDIMYLLEQCFNKVEYVMYNKMNMNAVVLCQIYSPTDEQLDEVLTLQNTNKKDITKFIEMDNDNDENFEFKQQMDANLIKVVNNIIYFNSNISNIKDKIRLGQIEK
jgi:hypothetical protein